MNPNLKKNKSELKAWGGVWTALVTPFDSKERIDKDAFHSLLETQIEAGVEGVVICGTTGESPTLSEDEKKFLIQEAVKKCRKKIRVLAGTGSNCTSDTIGFSQQAQDLGVDGFLVVVPYYNKPSQRGLQKHFESLAEKVKLPILLYNVPGRTIVSLSASTVASLSRHPRIVGIKEASGNMNTLTEMRGALEQSQRKSFTFLTGDDPTYLPFLASGGHGVISVMSNLIPKTAVEMQKKFERGETKAAFELFEMCHSFFNHLFVEANPVPLKYLMGRLKICRPEVRSPLAGMLSENEKRVSASWNELVKQNVLLDKLGAV